MRVWTPRSYQLAMREFVLKMFAKGARGVNLFAGVGVGKTSTALSIADALLLCGYAGRVLVIAPKRVATDAWPPEIELWSDFAHLRYAVAVGGKKERLAAIHGNAPIVIVNYDVLPAFIMECGDKWNFDVVIADESTRLKSHRVSQQTSKTGKVFFRASGGKQSSSIGKIAHSRVKFWLNLTGSPAPNGLIDLWAQVWFCDAGRRLGRTYTAFEKRWFQSVPRGERLELEPLEFAQEQIQNAIKDICLTIEAKDYFDLPPLVESVVHVELPPKAMAIYKKFEKEMFAEIEGVGVEAFNAAAMTMKCRQIANGQVYYDDEKNWQEVHDAKLEALRECVLDANGMPVLVAYQFQTDVARIKKAFPKAVHINDDPKAVEKFNAGLIPMLLGHPAGMGHGISLQHGTNYMVDYATGFNLEHDEQVIGRIGPTRQAQSGYNRTVYRRRLIAKGTIEEYCLKRIKTKDSIQQMLREAMKGEVCDF